VDDITLNEQQNEALKKMLDFVNSDKKMFVLKGYAGTGKTTTIQFFLRHVNTEDIVFTAPTHKAVKVLRNMAVENGSNINCTTIHSLLGLKVKNKKDKQIIVKSRDSDECTAASNYKIIVVDECSMISRELFSYIAESAEELAVKYIFMGDPAQLPPVGEYHSIVFDIEESYQLTKVMRQRDESPILGVCTDIRESISAANTSMKIPTINTLTTDTGHGARRISRVKFIDSILPAFSHELFNDNPDRSRVIAWRNNTVNKINDIIHNYRYPDCKEWLAPGEQITFVKPLLNKSLVKPPALCDMDGIVVNTDFEARVLSCERGVYSEYENIPAWKVNAIIEGRSDSVEFYALDKNGLIARDLRLREIADEIKKSDKYNDWRDYYELRGSYAEVRPAYCLTAHKSQGSTFDNVFVDAGDIWANRNKKEALKCLYVAVSRAKNNLIVTV